MGLVGGRAESGKSTEAIVRQHVIYVDMELSFL